MTKSQAIFDRMLREAMLPPKVLILHHICKVCDALGPRAKATDPRKWVCDDCREALR